MSRAAEKFNDLVQELVNDYCEEYDFSDGISEAVENHDFGEQIEEIVKDRMPDFDDEIASAVENYDFSDAIKEAVENVNWWDEIESKVQEDVTEQIHDYMDSHDAREALRSIIKDVVREMVKDALLAPFRWLKGKVGFQSYYRAKMVM